MIGMVLGPTFCVIHFCVIITHNFCVRTPIFKENCAHFLPAAKRHGYNVWVGGLFLGLLILGFYDGMDFGNSEHCQ